MIRSTILFVAAGLVTAAWAEPAQAQRYRGRWGGYYGNYGYYRPSYGYYQNYGYGGYYPRNYGYSYPGTYGYGYVAPRYYNYPSYSYYQPNYNYVIPYSSGIAYNPIDSNNQGQTSTSFYGNPELMGNQVRVRVILPDASARLWVENQVNQATGTERMIVSPPLDPNMNYTYTMKATWMENGQEVTREKKVDVKPGQEIVVNFNLKP